MKYIAHTKENSSEVQLLAEHLVNTQKIAERHGGLLNLSHCAGLAGLVHDLGKFRPEFQEYITSGDEKRGSVDHSSFGAMMIYQEIPKLVSVYPDKQFHISLFGEVIENAIFSHHNSLGLKDYLNTDLKSPFRKRIDSFLSSEDNIKELNQAIEHFYQEVMPKKQFEEYLLEAYREFTNIFSKLLEDKHNLLSNIYYLSEFIYSCLIDADHTDTALFELGKKELQYDSQTIFDNYYQKLLDSLKKFAVKSEIDQARAEMSDECDLFANKDDDIYRLSIPTGGGKTLTSLRYALKHAVLKQKKRIIYVLPYITIIEQNARVMREVLNGNSNDSTNILEFHSSVSNDLKSSSKETTNIISLAEDNWDSPIIVTTMVQFLNSIYAIRTSNRRRFHNLCDSVIVFDEVQKVPLNCLSMFNKILNFLKDVGQCGIVLCTATQPALDQMKAGTPVDMAESPEMIGDLDDRIAQFKRVQISNWSNINGRDKILSVDEVADKIADQLEKHGSVLGIFNTISITEQIYERLAELKQEQDDNYSLYCLTTHMCSVHRQTIIKKIKEDLSANRQVICISTPLIEAGVDISFACVVRSLTGLDSVVQAAGRCNRNAERKYGDVYLVLVEGENLRQLPEIKRGREIVQGMLSGGYSADSFLGTEAIEHYFRVLYQDLGSETEFLTSDHGHNVKLASCIDGSELCGQYVNTNSGELPPTKETSSSETIARHFEVISSDTVSLIAPYGKGKEIIVGLNAEDGMKHLASLIHDAQPYIVNVFKTKFDQLLSEGIVKELGNGYVNTDIFAITDRHYDESIGLTEESKSKPTFMSF